MKLHRNHGKFCLTVYNCADKMILKREKKSLRYEGPVLTKVAVASRLSKHSACLYIYGINAVDDSGKSGYNNKACERMFPLSELCARGEIGIHDGFRYHCESVGVRVPSGVPRQYPAKRVMFGGVFFMREADKNHARRW